MWKPKPPVVDSCLPGRSAQIFSEYHHGTSSSGRLRPKTSTTMPSSNAGTRSGTSATMA